MIPPWARPPSYRCEAGRDDPTPLTPLTPLTLHSVPPVTPIRSGPVALVAVLVTAPCVFAQQPADTGSLAPVVVTATRVPVRPTAPFVSTTVISGDRLRAQGITSLQDALAQVPGVVVARSGSYGMQTSLFLRGGESDYTEVLIDGVPVNQPGGFLDLANLTTDNIDRIEVVRGPASVLYGSSAVTGVVQIFTRDGSGGTHARASVRAGTYGSNDLDVGVGGGGDAVSGSLGIGRHRTDGIYAFNNSGRNDVYSGALRLAPDGRTSVKVALRYGDAGVHVPTNYYGAVVDSNQFELQRRFTASVDAGRVIDSRLAAHLLLGASDEHTQSVQGPNAPGESCDFCYDSRAGIYRRSADARLDFYPVPSIVLSGGAAIDHQHAHESGSDPMGRNVWAYYAQAVGNNGRASYTAGVRVDDNSQFGTFTTYRAAIGLRVAHGTDAHVSFGTSFKEPTFDETNSASPYARGNPALRPERSESWDAGLSQRVVEGALTLSATYFRQRFRDMIQYDAAPPDSGAPNYFNLAAANADGLELEARSARWHGWSVAAGYTWLDTKVTDAGVDGGPAATFAAGSRLLRRPTNIANANVTFRPGARGSAGVDVSYVGNRDDIDFLNYVRVRAPAYTTVALSGALALTNATGLAPGISLTARVENLFGTRYEPIYGFRAPGRAVLVGIAASR